MIGRDLQCVCTSGALEINGAWRAITHTASVPTCVSDVLIVASDDRW